MMSMTLDLEWQPYNMGGAVCRVREFFTRGDYEYELCVEGGQYVIRRTEWKDGKKVTVEETARGRERDTKDVWRTIVTG